MKRYSFKFRIYPNNKQKELINKTIGCNRLLYNLMLNERNKVYEQLKDDKEKLYKYKYRTIKEIKSQYKFMNEIDSQSFNWTLVNLKDAYNNFYKSLKIKNGFGFPKFKKKKNGGSYTTSNVYNTIELNFKDRKVKLPKLKWIKFRDNRVLEGSIKHATISKDPSDRYFCSILIDLQDNDKELIKLPNNPKIIGLDMSLSNFYIDSNNNSPEFIKLNKKFEKRINRLNYILSRKKKDSMRYKKLRKSINNIYFHIKNIRNNFTHNLSTKLVRENDTIVVESLSLKNMSKLFGKSISDLGYSEFIKQLQYKSKENGKYLIFADKWFASSKICNNCGYKYKELTLKERKWICPNCGAEINRDLNAALNLKDLGESIIRKCTLR